MQLNKKGLALIREFEGLYLEAYRCPAGYWTIGYGHTGQAAFEGNRISENEAERLLAEDLWQVAEEIKRRIAQPLNPNQFSALVSFAFNVGTQAFAESTLLRLLNQGNYQAALGEFSRWNKARVEGELQVLRGLSRRRAAEANLFATPLLPRPGLKASCTIGAGRVAVAATGGALALEYLEAFSPRSALGGFLMEKAPWVLLAVVLVAVGYMIFARVDDFKSGLR